MRSTSTIDRRRFRRLEMTDNALVVDGAGKELGRVSQASGGGMMILTATMEIADSLKIGQELLVCVIEPENDVQTKIDIIVRYKEKDMVGVEFVTGKK